MRYFLLLFFILTFIFSKSQTVGIFQNDTSSYNGYTLFSASEDTYLIDNCGREINKWTSLYKPGSSVYLLEDGSLLRTCRIQSQIFTGGGSGGRVEKYAWDNTLLWSYDFSDSIYHQHHDIEPMANGNILVLCWERLSAVEAIDLGRDPNYLIDNELWTTYIMEVEPVAYDSINIVWEWHLKDHLIQDFDSTKNNYGVISENPQLLDINFFQSQGKKDWMHCNSISYNALLDEIMISSRTMSEIYIIDHSTTTIQAASSTGGYHNKGGNIIYRWGNPQVYQQGGINDRKLFGQHDAHWIPENYIDGGNIMIFNNGRDRGYSSVDIIDPLKNTSGQYLLDSNGVFFPDSAYWQYQDSNPQNFYSSYISGSQRLPNGNTLICDGAHGTFFEIDKNKDVVWKYINPVLPNTILSQGDTIPTNQNGFANSVFRCHRYSPSFNGFFGNDLSPSSPIEINPSQVNCEIVNDIVYINKTNKEIIKIIDVIGRESHIAGTQLLLYIYSDGTVEKRFVIQ